MVTLWIDALSLHWGTHFAGDKVSGDLPEHLQHAHIGVKELYAIYAGLRTFLTWVAGAHIEFMCNNKLAVLMISKLKTRLWACCD